MVDRLVANAGLPTPVTLVVGTLLDAIKDGVAQILSEIRTLAVVAAILIFLAADIFAVFFVALFASFVRRVFIGTLVFVEALRHIACAVGARRSHAGHPHCERGRRPPLTAIDDAPRDIRRAEQGAGDKGATRHQDRVAGRGTAPGSSTFRHFPFGGGPRVCIGKGFAMMESVLVLATLLRRVRADMVQGWPVELEPVVTLRPRHGLGMTISSRRGQ